MNSCRKSVLFIVLMLVCFPCYGAALADEASGFVTVIKGEVNKRSVVGDWKGLKEQEQVITGERVRTFEDSLAEIIIHDTQKIRLGPETTVDFQRVFAEGEKKVSNLDLMEGDLWAEMDKLDEDSSFEVNSKLAHVTVRGTVFSLHAGQDEAVLNVYRGAVEVGGEQKVERNSHKPNEISVPMGVAGPIEVAGPQEVLGPKEVTLKEWIQIVAAMQQIVISKDGSWQVRDIAKHELQQGQWKKWGKQLQHD